MTDSALSGGSSPSGEMGPAPEALVDGEELARLHVFVGCAVREATGRAWWEMRTAGEWREAARAVGVTPVPLGGVSDFTPRPVLAGARWLYYYPAGVAPEREARWLAAGVAWILIYRDRHRLPVAGAGRVARSQASEAAFLRVAAQTFVAGVFGRGDHGHLGRVRHLPPAPSVARLVLSEAAPLVIGRGERWMPPETHIPALTASGHAGAQRGSNDMEDAGTTGRTPAGGDGPGAARAGSGATETLPRMDEFEDALRRLGEPMPGLLRMMIEQTWTLNRQIEAFVRQAEALERVMLGQQDLMRQALIAALNAPPETLGDD